MHQVLENISLSGIIAPGDVYILSAEKYQGWDPGPIDEMYILTHDEDLLPAFEMELCIFLADLYEPRKLIKWGEILDGCYEFRFLCYDKTDEKEIGYSLFLHRLPTFSEKLACVKKSS
jgi:hypothetical protein